MPIKELTPEQLRTWTLEQKDKWWLENVYKGDMPQLNLRSALTGMILGGILTMTNLYVGIKTGWTLGVGISSVILSFAIFKLFSKLKIGNEMTILENNAMQSVATSAGYMAGPLMSSITAYMMVTGQVLPMWHAFWWVVAISTMGILFAFPLKKRFINDEQLPFPEGYAAAVVLDNLHDEQGKAGFFKAKILMAGASFSALVELLRSEKITHAIKMPFLNLPEYWDDLIYKFFTPAVLGTPLKDLTIRWDTSIVLMGTGGLMSMKTAMSMLLGAFINYFVLAPYLIKQGIITGTGFKNITMWALWAGVAMMTTSSLYSFFSKPDILIQGFKRLFAKKEKKSDVLEDIELPMWIFAVGIPIMTVVIAIMGHMFFGIHYMMGLIAIPLVFVFTIIAVNSTGLTSITPIGALGKLTQITFAAIAPGNVPTNLMTAGITAEVSSNASNLLMDIKPAYMLGGKPRHQAVGHFLGIFAGGIVAIPVFYALFHGDVSLFGSDKMPLPSAAVWKAVAEILTQGLSVLHPTAQAAVVIGAVLGIAIEYIDKKSHGRFPISAMGLGLAFVMRFTDSLSMALGALLFYIARKNIKNQDSLAHKVMVDNQETLSAGIIAGGSIIGILIILAETALL